MKTHKNSPNNERTSTGQEMQMGSNELTEMAGQKPKMKFKGTPEQKAAHAENAELKEMLKQFHQVQQEYVKTKDPELKKELDEIQTEIRAAKMEHQMDKTEKTMHFDGKFDGHEDPDIFHAADAVAATHKKLDAKSVLLGIAIGVTAYWAVKKFHLLGKA
jgi:cell fate (sporulation/competence/biofilm development) regulator YlbF (YheA/YmcA/DUF963 family)